MIYSKSHSLNRLTISILIICWFIGITPSNGQGLNHNFLFGYTSALDSFTTSTRARLLLDQFSVSVIPETKQQKFLAGQGNISDQNGNLLAVSNGIWVANANGDTMLNGSGLNPNSFTADWNYLGIPFVHSNFIIPLPDDSAKYLLFHMTGNYNAPYLQLSSEVYYSEIDMQLDGGLGGITQKNNIVVQDQLCPGMAACKHANGRDWWVVFMRDSSDLVYKVLVSTSGVVSVTTQQLNVPFHNRYHGQPQFSPDGKKFAYLYFTGPMGNHTLDVRLLNFDRCSGMFTSPQVIDISDTHAGYGLSFSPNSKVLYAASFENLYQMEVDSPIVANTVQTVAINDGFYSPLPPLQTDFWLMYLGANGKIYMSSGNSVLDLHYINYPDSVGMACDVQLHSLHLPCYSGRGNVYHPNYYLSCDTILGCTCLTTGSNEILENDFVCSILPNPTNGNFKVSYLLPYGREGKLEIFDMSGHLIYYLNLPSWSTIQYISLPSTLSNGIYNCSIISGGVKINEKIVLIRD